MPETETLKIFERDTTVSASKLRSIGYLPATIYGKDFPSQSVQVKTHDMELALARGVRRFKLDGAGNNIVAKAQQVQKNSALAQLLHVEFHVDGAKA